MYVLIYRRTRSVTIHTQCYKITKKILKRLYCHLMYLVYLVIFIYFTVSQNLEINADYMHSYILTLNGLRFNLRAQIFLGGIPPDPPSISMLCMLIMLRTMERIFRYPRYPYAILSPPSNPLCLILTPLD